LDLKKYGNPEEGYDFSKAKTAKQKAEVIGIWIGEILYETLTYKVNTTTKVSPENYILLVFTPGERLEAAFKIASETFRKTTLTVKDKEKAVENARRKAYRVKLRD